MVVWCGGVLQHAMPDSRKSASPALRTVIEWEVCGVYFEISPGSFSMTQNTAVLVYIDTLYCSVLENQPGEALRNS